MFRPVLFCGGGQRIASRLLEGVSVRDGPATRLNLSNAYVSAPSASHYQCSRSFKTHITVDTLCKFVTLFFLSFSTICVGITNVLSRLRCYCFYPSNISVILEATKWFEYSKECGPQIHTIG